MKKSGTNFHVHCRVMGLGSVLLFVSLWGEAAAIDAESLSLDSLLAVPISSAAKYEQTTLEAPASVTVITAEDIRKFGWRSLEDIMFSVRSFHLSDDRNYSFLGVRGYLRPSDYNNRILVLLNGTALNEMTQGQPPLNTLFTLDLNVIERIEIVRGPGSALYGTNAMLATVNIVTKKAEGPDGLSVAGTAATPRGSGLAARYSGEVGNGWDLTLSGSFADQRGDDVYFPEYDSPETNNGVAQNLDWEKAGGLFARAIRNRLKLQAYLMSRNKGIPTATWAVTFNDPKSETEDTYAGVDAELGVKTGGNSDLTIRAFMNSFHYDGMYPYDPPDTDNPDYLNEKRVGVESRWHYFPHSDNQLVMGAEYVNHFQNDYYSADEEVVFSDEKHAFSDLSVFAQDEHTFRSSLVATAGVRHTWYTQGFNALVPRAGLVILPATGTSVKALYGEAFRVPTITEAYYWFPEQSKANPDLKPERIRSFELVGEHRIGRSLNGSVSLYSFKVFDLINMILDPEDELTVYRNTGAAEGRGLELELVYRTEHGVSGYASYVSQIAEEEPGDDFLSNAPKQIGKAGISFPIHTYVRLAVEGLTETSRFTLLRTKTDPIALLNATVTTRPILDPVRLSFSVRNVLNTSYGHPGSWDHLQPTSNADMAIIPQRGRTVTLQLGYQF